MKLMKNKLDKKVYIVVLIATIISISSSYVLAETLINSKDVYYDKTSSGLAVNNVQAAIDGTCTKFSDQLTTLQTTIINKIYPIGSIYISYNSNNPNSLFGGTWENYGNGRVLRGINSGTAGVTGGSDTVTLKEANLPSHNHSIPALSGTTGSAGEHTHSFTNTFASAALGKAMTQFTGFAMGADSGRNTFSVGSGIGYSGTHTHSVTTVANNTGYTGSGTAFSTLDPYITVYMWRRTK